MDGEERVQRAKRTRLKIPIAAATTLLLAVCAVAIVAWYRQSRAWSRFEQCLIGEPAAPESLPRLLRAGTLGGSIGTWPFHCERHAKELYEIAARAIGPAREIARILDAELRCSQQCSFPPVGKIVLHDPAGLWHAATRARLRRTDVADVPAPDLVEPSGVSSYPEIVPYGDIRVYAHPSEDAVEIETAQDQTCRVPSTGQPVLTCQKSEGHGRRAPYAALPVDSTQCAGFDAKCEIAVIDATGGEVARFTAPFESRYESIRVIGDTVIGTGPAGRSLWWRRIDRDALGNLREVRGDFKRPGSLCESNGHRAFVMKDPHDEDLPDTKDDTRPRTVAVSFYREQAWTAPVAIELTGRPKMESLGCGQGFAALVWLEKDGVHQLRCTPDGCRHRVAHLHTPRLLHEPRFVGFWKERVLVVGVDPARTLGYRLARFDDLAHARDHALVERPEISGIDSQYKRSVIVHAGDAAAFVFFELSGGHRGVRVNADGSVEAIVKDDSRSRR